MVQNTRTLSIQKSNYCCLSEGFYRGCRLGADQFTRTRRSTLDQNTAFGSTINHQNTIKQCLCEKRARDTGDTSRSPKAAGPSPPRSTARFTPRTRSR